MIVSIPARARMRPAHQLARAQHQLAGRDVGAPDPLLNSAAVERRLRRAVQRGKITGTGHISARWGVTLTARPVYGRGNLTGEMGQRQETFMSVYTLKEEPVFFHVGCSRRLPGPFSGNSAAIGSIFAASGRGSADLHFARIRMRLTHRAIGRALRPATQVRSRIGVAEQGTANRNLNRAAQQ